MSTALTGRRPRSQIRRVSGTVTARLRERSSATMRVTIAEAATVREPPEAAVVSNPGAPAACGRVPPLGRKRPAHPPAGHLAPWLTRPRRLQASRIPRRAAHPSTGARLASSICATDSSCTAKALSAMVAASLGSHTASTRPLAGSGDPPASQAAR